MNYDFIVPVVYKPENNNSHIGKETILFQDCSGFASSNNDCEGYNFNKCPNDDNYCQPFIEGDLIYKQIIINTTKYDNATYETIDLSTGNPFTPAGQYSIVANAISEDDRNLYFTIILDTTGFPESWYIKINFEKIDESEDDFMTTEPYKLVGCNEDTLLITGSYSKYDCEGGYYGIFANVIPNPYKPSFRVRGRIEPQGFVFEKTSNGRNTLKSKQSEKYTLFTDKVPYYVAQQMAVAFNSREMLIDGVKYSGTLKLDKNFEEGSNWIIKEDIFKDCDEISFTCE